MTWYVVDSSAWLRLFLGDGPLPPDLVQAVAELEHGNATWAAPELLLVEVANVLLRKRRHRELTAVEVNLTWADMRQVPVELVPILVHLDAARELSDRHRLTVYDALYLALAQHLGARLLTADEQLARAARKR